MMRTAEDLLQELTALDESHRIEAKQARQIDRSMMETVCAFANEPGLGGGYLLLGVSRDPQDLFSNAYRIDGIDDTDKLQSDLASQCASVFNRPIRPRVSVEELNGESVVVVFVPEAAPTEKPIFLQNLGLPRGAFRRVGPTDLEGTEDDLVALYAGHQMDTFDAALLADADMSDIDPAAIDDYRQQRRTINPDAEELAWANDDLLRSLGCARPDNGQLKPTVAGIVLFGSTMSLRRCFPMMRIDYIRVPGRQWVENPDHRFDTLEIRAPGHSIKAEEQLGEPGSETRSPHIAAVLHEVNIAETKGSGIRAMRELMLAQDLLPPTFESSRRPDQFVATFLFHHFLGPNDLAWLRNLTNETISDEESRALVFVRELGAIDNAAYRAINRTDTLNASGHLRRLRDLELLEMKGAGSRTYYVPGPRFLVAQLAPVPAIDSDPSNSHQDPQDSHQSSKDSHQLLATIPADLAARVPPSGSKPRREILRALIVDLCRWRASSARELASILNDREHKPLVRDYLTPMVGAGLLAYTIPAMENHPDQRYTVPAASTEDGGATS